MLKKFDLFIKRVDHHFVLYSLYSKIYGTEGVFTSTYNYHAHEQMWIRTQL